MRTLTQSFAIRIPACYCHNIGSLDPFCRDTDGQCKCDENAYGRQCDECQPGYHNFPDCKPCQCNGHAATCSGEEGVCNDCRYGNMC